MVRGMEVEDVHTVGLETGQGGGHLLQNTLSLQTILPRIGLCCYDYLSENHTITTGYTTAAVL